MDADQGVAVAALVERAADPAPAATRRSLSTDDPRAWREHRARTAVESSRPSAGREPVWRVEEDQIVFAPARCVRCGGTRGRRRGAPRPSRSERPRFAPHRAQRGRRAVHERRLAPRRARAPRSRARPSRRTGRARPRRRRRRGSQNSASRTRSEVGRVRAPRGATRRRAAEAAGDDPRIAALTPGSARAPRRRRRRAARRRAARARARSSSGSAREQRSARSWARSQQLGVLGQPGDAELRRARTGACR